MATLTVQDVGRNAVNEITDASADAGGDQFANVNADVLFLVINDDASPKTVTAEGNSSENYGRSLDTDHVIPATSVGIIGPLAKNGYNTVDADTVEMTYSAVTSVRVAAIKIDKAKRMG